MVVSSSVPETHRVRVREVNRKKHQALIRAIARLAQADITEPTRTIKSARVAKPPDDKQRERGRKGEEEVLERLKDGYLGFTFKDDHRKNGCGYDFLAHDGKRDVEIEVKSFDSRVGQIFFTEKEFERALENSDNYHLWALLDNGGDPSTWDLWALSAPHAELKRVGEEQVSIVYRIPPSDVKWEERIVGPTTPRKKKGKHNDHHRS